MTAEAVGTVEAGVVVGVAGTAAVGTEAAAAADTEEEEAEEGVAETSALGIGEGGVGCTAHARGCRTATWI